MTRGTENPQPQEGKAVIEELNWNDLMGIVSFRVAVRDMLGQVGVPSNPGSLDSELLDGLAEKLGVTNNYDYIREGYEMARRGEDPLGRLSPEKRAELEAWARNVWEQTENHNPQEPQA